MSDWLDKKLKDRDINYFEYDKFSSIVEIGKGGFSRVYKAYLASKGLEVALKNFNENSNIEEDKFNEFIRELKLLRQVYYHDNINSFLGITKNPIGNYVIVLAYANEGNLRDYLKRKFTSLTWENKIQMALNITCGLKCLHSEEIIHRDLHSKNILVNNGKLLITDFGLSKQLAEAASSSIANKMGMVAYIDPQCYKNIKFKKNKKSDIYSLGVLLWEISSGKPPFYNYQRDESYLLGFHISYNNQREKPIEGTPPKYQQLYQECWDGDPNLRPDIEKVYETLSQIETEFSRSSQINIGQEELLKSNLDDNYDLTLSVIDPLDSRKEKEKEEIGNKYIDTIPEVEEEIKPDESRSSTVVKKNFFRENKMSSKMTSVKWIEGKIKDKYIRYFEYNEFSQVTEIGKGSFATVSKANLANNGLVALKNLFDKNSNIEDDYYKFVNEIKLLREVDHDNINRILGITEDSRYYILVLEYANEGTLRDYLKKNFISLEWKDKIQMALDITCGLKFLHSKGIIHRNLHSRNVLVKDGKLLIADFGLSKKLAEAASNSIINKMGMVEYIDPQCYKNNKFKKDKKSDIYSLGVLLWEISSGHPPFPDYQRDALGILGCREKPIDGTPLEYQQLYQECWDDEPKSRPDIEKVYEILSQLKKLNINESSDSQLSQLQEYENNDSDKFDSKIFGLNICEQIVDQLSNVNSTITPDLTKPNDRLEEEKTKTLLIVGRTGSGKSALSNVLTGTDDFEECEYSARETKDFQEEVFEYKGTKYRVIDLGVNSIENFTNNKIRELMSEGISQVLFVVDGRFTQKEIDTFNLFEKAIFSSGIINYTTIVRTKFYNFKNKLERENDKNQMCNESKAIAKMVKTCGQIVYVDNPPTKIIVNDEDDQERVNSYKRLRERSRAILLDHLEIRCHKKYNKCDDEIFNYLKFLIYHLGALSMIELSY